jgi:photosystem II stability/assembly factor-like uncharacterized protein
MRLRIRLAIFCILGYWICACDISETRSPDTLTFRLDDSLKTSSGKYDSVRLDLYTMSGADTIYARTLFHGVYRDSDQLRNLSLGRGSDGNFLVRVIAYRNGKSVLEVGVPFTKGESATVPIVYRVPAPDSSTHAPYFLSGLQDISMNEGESRRIVLKAKDTDGDPIHFQILNLDSLRFLFPANSIQVATDADSLVLDFSPGSVQGDFRFRIALLDPSLPSVIQTLTVSVGVVDRPPSIVIHGPGPGSVFTLKEGETLSLRVSAQDPDSGDSAVLLPLENPPWPACGKGGYDTASGTLFFTPSFQCASARDTTFSDWVFKAGDAGKPPELGQATVRVTVRDSNSAPKWKSASVPVAGKEGEAMGLDLSGIYIGDDENDSVEFYAGCGSIDAKSFRWSFTPGFRDAGAIDCEIDATDAHNPPAASKVILKLTIADSVRMVDVAIVSPVRGFVTRDSLVIVKWKVGDEWQAQDTLEILHSEGPNAIRRSYKDSVGHIGFDSIIVYRDTESPLAPVFTTDSISPTNNPRPTWSWKTGGRGGSGSYRIKLGDTLWAPDGQQGVFATFTPKADLPEGRHTLFVEERDSAGNWSGPGSFSIETDYTPPNAPVLTSKAFHTLNPKPVWQWSSGGNGGNGSFRYKLDDAQLSSGGSISQAASYAPALSFAIGSTHVLYVQERDRAGNWSEAASYGIHVHGKIGYAVGPEGAIAKTINEGETWDTLPRPTQANLNSVWFQDQYNGVIAGDSGLIFRTGNGGLSWGKLSVGTTDNLNAILFINNDVAFLGGNNGLIARTPDGGNTWSTTYPKNSRAIFSMGFSDGANGIAVGAGSYGSRGSISVTSDSGKTWTIPVQDAAYGLLSIYSIDSKTAVCVGQNGSILRTADSGKSWNEMSSGTSEYLISVFFLSPNMGFASGDKGTILKTIDGGFHWSAIKTNYTDQITSLYFLDDMTGFAAGGGPGGILKTEDGGESWKKISLPVWVNYDVPQYPRYDVLPASRIFFP